jgi:FMN-dependent NADH-azoreductase
MPAIVKAWFDSVMQRGITFGKRNDGQIIKPNTGKRALTLISCRGIYSTQSSSVREHVLSLSNLEFQFMGYSDVRGILAEGMAMNEEVKQNNLNKSTQQVQAIARVWYRRDEYDLVSISLCNQKKSTK